MNSFGGDVANGGGGSRRRDHRRGGASPVLVWWRHGHRRTRVRVGRGAGGARGTSTVRLGRRGSPLPHIRLARHAQDVRHAASSVRLRWRRSDNRPRANAGHVRQRHSASAQPGTARPSGNADRRRAARTGEAVPRRGVGWRPHAPLRGGRRWGSARTSGRRAQSRPPPQATVIARHVGGEAHQRDGSGVGAGSSGDSARGGAPRTTGDAREGGGPQAARDGNRRVVGGHDARGRPLQPTRGPQNDSRLGVKSPLGRWRRRKAE